MKRLPGVRLLVLGETHGVLAGPAVSGLLHGSGHCPAQVTHGQPKGAADGRVGPVSRAKYRRAAMNAQPVGNRPADDDHRRGPACGSGDGANVELGLQYRLDRRQDHREVVGLAPCHHAVDGDLLYRDRAIQGRNPAQNAGARHLTGLQHLQNQVLGGRHDGQPIGPTLVVKVVVYLADRPGHLETAGRFSGACFTHR